MEQESAWKPVREMLADISPSRAIQGFAPSETALFVFSAKRPIFPRCGMRAKMIPNNLRRRLGWRRFSSITWRCTPQSSTKRHERDLIKRQEEELLEL